MTTRLAAGIAVLATIAVAVVALWPRLSPGGSDASPASSPTAVATPSATVARKIIDRTTAAGYTLAVPESWNYGIQPWGVYLSASAPIISASMCEGEVVAGSSPPHYRIIEGTIDSGDIVVEGRTVAALLASTNASYLTHLGSRSSGERDLTIDGEPAAVTEHAVERPKLLYLDAVVIHGDRAYAFVVGAPPDHAAELNAIFYEVLASIRWTG